jgi:hypothetical protein
MWSSIKVSEILKEVSVFFEAKEIARRASGSFQFIIEVVDCVAVIEACGGLKVTVTNAHVTQGP